MLFCLISWYNGAKKNLNKILIAFLHLLRKSEDSNSLLSILTILKRKEFIGLDTRSFYCGRPYTNQNFGVDITKMLDPLSILFLRPFKYQAINKLSPAKLVLPGRKDPETRQSTLYYPPSMNDRGAYSCIIYYSILIFARIYSLFQ